MTVPAMIGSSAKTPTPPLVLGRTLVLGWSINELGRPDKLMISSCRQGGFGCWGGSMNRRWSKFVPED
jgi:hypothetical protein